MGNVVINQVEQSLFSLETMFVLTGYIFWGVISKKNAI